MKDLNAKRLFLASFFTLIAAGIGFSVRGVGLLSAWREEFRFTMSDLGGITGGGLVGFGITIILLSLIADRIGYGPLMILAFLLHVSSALVTLAATPVYRAYGPGATYWCLFIGMFLFSLGNGTCEAVINPLTATLFPKAKTHWLNILHAGWPGGLVLGVLISMAFDGLSAFTGPIRWEFQMAVFLVPTLAYGGLMFGCTFPKSEASESGVSLGTMLFQFASPILLFLLLLHALVGYVELGTDSWIANITGRIMEKPLYGGLLFGWTSFMMFVLRFFAGPIVHRISPLGLLCASAMIGCTGLVLLGMVPSGVVWFGSLPVSIIFCVFAATVYGLGKTFLWPTMLGVVGERFPKGGAMTMGAMGGVGMLSAGLLGGPAIGYEQDYYASRELDLKSSHTYERYESPEQNSFLPFLHIFPVISGLDGGKVKALNDNGEQLGKDMEVVRKANEPLTFPEMTALSKLELTSTLTQPSMAAAVGLSAPAVAQQDSLTEGDYLALKKVGPKLTTNADVKMLNAWWEQRGKEHAAEDKPLVVEAELYGGQMALLLTAAVPATMALGYLLLIFYFRMTGGYKQVHLDEQPKLPDVGDRAPLPPPNGDAEGYTDGIPGEGVESTPL